jgi:hypothetical protein
VEYKYFLKKIIDLIKKGNLERHGVFENMLLGFHK